MENKFFPIILGSDDNAYATARCFNDEYGIKPLCLCATALAQTDRSAILKVKAIKDFDQPEIFVNVLLNELKEHEKMGKLIVIPCADYYTELLVNNYHLFDGRIANKFVSPELMARISTKDGFYSLCEEKGLYYPKTVICDVEDRLTVYKDLPFGFPIVMKPENSNASEYLHCAFEGKKKVYFLKNEDEYLSVVTKMNQAGYNGKLIIQKLIRGGDTTSFVVNSYSGINGKVRFMCMGQALLEEYAPNMLGNYAGIMSVSIPELYKQIEDFLNGIGFVGFSNIDVKYDAENEKFCFFELNPRHGRSSYFVRAAGYNLMAELVSDAVFEAKRDCTTYGDKESVWASVPKRTLMKYLMDPEVKVKTKKIIRKKGIVYSYKNPKDKDIIRALKFMKIVHNKVNSYKAHFFDKTQL